jgi:hypothetical protein
LSGFKLELQFFILKNRKQSNESEEGKLKFKGFDFKQEDGEEEGESD